MKDKITGIILAGGKSRRMGTDKAFIQIMNKPLAEYVAETLKPFCSRILISGNISALDVFGYSRISDNFSDTGPIGGLEACLAATDSLHNIFIPCDMPLVNPKYILEIIKHIKPDNKIVAYKTAQFPEPFPAYYSKEILPLVRRQIADKNYKLQSLLKSHIAYFLETKPDFCLSNINTKEDLKKANKELLKIRRNESID